MLDKLLECWVWEDKEAEVQEQVIMVEILVEAHTVLVQILAVMVEAEQVCN